MELLVFLKILYTYDKCSEHRTYKTELQFFPDDSVLMLYNTQMRLQECHEHNLNHLPLQCSLQDKNQHINYIFNKIKALGGDGNSNCDGIIRPTSQLAEWKSLLTQKHADIHVVQLVQHEFSSQFQILQKT